MTEPNVPINYGEKPAVDGSLDRDLKDVTTSSIEADRYYAEGINLHEGFRGQDAIAPLEKAIAIDPGFAMALAKLAIVHSHLSHPNQYADYARRAFEHIDRITARERYYVEGMYYANRNQTFVKAVDAYKKAVELFPDHASLGGGGHRSRAGRGGAQKNRVIGWRIG